MPRLSFSGFSSTDEANARAAFADLRLQDWSLSDEASADAVLFDLDSMYGQMAWMKGIDAAKTSIGLTRALRADTAFRLGAPLAAQALAEVLGKVSEVLDATHGATPAPAPSPVAGRLAAIIARATGPFALQTGDLPRLVIDPQRQQFASGRSLKALLGYASLDLPAEAIEALDANAAAADLAQIGDPQPLARLVWLLALGGGEGRLLNHDVATRFQLGRWPQTEREFPKHFRIATVMLKAPVTVAEIATASGANEAEVADYINAALAVGYARVI